MKFEIWPTKKAAALRKAFIQQFIDMTMDIYGTVYKIIKSGKKNVVWTMPPHF